MIDFSPVRRKERTLQELAEGLTRDDLTRLANEMCDHFQELIATAARNKICEASYTSQWRFAPQYLALVNGNRGTVSNECRSGWLIQCLSELFAVKSCNVCVQFEARRVPNFPARMFHAVFAAAVAQRGVTPVMFSDKFGVRSRWNCLRLTSRRHFE